MHNKCGHSLGLASLVRNSLVRNSLARFPVGVGLFGLLFKMASETFATFG